MGSSSVKDMKKLAFLFPGQGSQTVGMGKDIFEAYEDIRKYYNMASEILGYDIKKLIFEGPSDTLSQTEYTQPAVFLTSYVIFKCFSEKYPEVLNYVKFVAGHSLGEYTALCISGALSFEETLKLVATRGKIMSEVSKQKPGGMVAVLGMEKDTLIKICEDIRAEGIIVEPVNFNTSQQIVVAGEIEGIYKLQKILEEKKIKNIRLKVSGAFHSSLMDTAQKNFSKTLDNVIINNAFIPVIMNYTAKPHILKQEILENLKQQINHPVLWEDSIKYMGENGVEIFIEFGPGKVLCGMLKSILPQKIILNIEKLDSFELSYNIIKEKINT
ncbi:MAG: ACP S-malonyltransferase [Endomicrobiia bacterium]